MRVQVLSDLHMEASASFDIASCPVDGSTLILAGDTDKANSVAHILNIASKRWDHVVVLLGNHECYGTTMPKACELLKAAADAHPNVHYLNNSAVVIEGQRIVGSTLWSRPLTRTGLNDFNYIKAHHTYKKLALAAMHEWNGVAIRHLNESVGKGDIVATHFMPVLRTDLVKAGHKSSYTACALDSYFGNTGLGLALERAQLWVFGHTHEAVRVKIGNCLLLCHPIGYPGETENARCTAVATVTPNVGMK